MGDPAPALAGIVVNRLAGATSPYLLQHDDNPVDWYPWGDEAFALARAEDRPILLSVGYAACHWCHVMAHESFEDPATAALMNERFVSIKVDREERPDVDALYMDAVVALTGHGGWPMTVFLTPDGEPFYGGTYYPPEPRHGMPAFRGRARRGLGRLPRAARRRGAPGASARRGAPAVGGAAAVVRPADGVAARRGGARAAVAVRRALGRLRRRAEVPARVGARAPAAARRARARADDARRDGRRRDVRPRRRRLPPLLGRRALARAALREDAVRQRAAGPGLPARLGRHRRGALPRGRRGDARLHAARAAARRRAASRRRRTPTPTASRG